MLLTSAVFYRVKWIEEKVRLIYDDYEGVIKGEVPFLRDNHVAHLKKGIR